MTRLHRNTWLSIAAASLLLASGFSTSAQAHPHGGYRSPQITLNWGHFVSPVYRHHFHGHYKKRFHYKPHGHYKHHSHGPRYGHHKNKIVRKKLR